MLRHRTEDDMDINSSPIKRSSARMLLALEDIDKGGRDDIQGSGSERSEESDEDERAGIDGGSSEESEDSEVSDESSADDDLSIGREEDTDKSYEESEATEDTHLNDSDTDTDTNKAPKKRQSTNSRNPKHDAANDNPMLPQKRLTTNSLLSSLKDCLATELEVCSSSWRDIIRAIKATATAEATADDNQLGLPSLPKFWATEKPEVQIDSGRLLTALSILHRSMSSLFAEHQLACGVTNSNRKTQSRSYFKARQVARIEVAAAYIVDTPKFNKTWDAYLKTKPSTTSHYTKERIQTAKSKASQDIIDGLDENTKAAAVRKVDELSQSIVSQRISGERLSDPKVYGAGYEKSRARNISLIQVALSYVDQNHFQDQIAFESGIWEAKTTWFADHKDEVLAMSKTKIARAILSGLDPTTRAQADSSILRISAKVLDDWKNTKSRPLTDEQLRRKFLMLRRETRIIIAAEHITDWKKYKEAVDDRSRLLASRFKVRSHATKAAEYDIMTDIMSDLEANVKCEWLERAEALALAMMEGFVNGTEKLRVTGQLTAEMANFTPHSRDISNEPEASSSKIANKGKKVASLRHEKEKAQMALSRNSSEEDSLSGTDDTSADESSSEEDDDTEDETEMPVAKRPKTTSATRPSGISKGRKIMKSL
ncbi:uncharacterized protein LY89DRAFT_686684 [Mollisia scopiformis]|uniref:Uncharacterized protein n=1 Tax=Mollisia scopiformis TaxID=149040 RepID=A0A194X1V1_MOLSC|nr:uncharacterized protein LY89DRAFT_686684 [Mollisia scopiformis]KUJ14166.1 hypothetical protein LY89DRAFT_686684 [Mollisia scopiformis]